MKGLMCRLLSVYIGKTAGKVPVLFLLTINQVTAFVRTEAAFRI
jgi:hypothetical protein